MIGRRKLLTGALAGVGAALALPGRAQAYNLPSAITVPQGGALKYGVLGDSVTGRGSFASTQDNAWAWLLQSRLEQHWTVTRQDGTTNHDAQGDSCLATVATYPSGCDLLVIGLGTNDCREQNSDGSWVYSPSTVYANANTVYSNALQLNPGAVILGVGIWDTSLLTWSPTAGSRVVRFDALIAERCVENGGMWMPIADLWDYSPDRLPTGVAAFGGYTTDGFHPNDAGHQAIYNRAVNWLRLP